MTKRGWGTVATITVAAIMFIAVAIGLLLLKHESAHESRQQKQAYALDLADGSEYEVTILREEKELIRGLSGTQSLPENQMILFDFGYDDFHGIWMKDMNYAIDIIWLDKNGRVVYLVEDALPESYRNESDATIFRPNQRSRYVIEAISGTIKKTGLTINDRIKLPSGV